MNRSSLPVVVIGAGPVGLAAAAHLVNAGETPLVLEAGGAVGASIRSWGHVRLFSPWQYNIDSIAGKLLEQNGWRSPDAETFPTGAELVEHYLSPLACLPQLNPHIRLNHEVLAVTRQGFDKMKTVGREDAPFLLTVQTPDGEDEIIAKAVIDASGTYTSPNPLGASGVPALGERAFANHIYYGIPDILRVHRPRYAGRSVLVVGSGHSAFNAVLDLATLADEEPSTNITWVVRKADMRHVYGGGANDVLAARGELGLRVQQLVKTGVVRLVTSFKVQRLVAEGKRVVVVGERETVGPFDEIIATTGFRPDMSLLSELRLDLDAGVESPTVLAPLIDPNFHSCGTVRPHGAEELKHPEQDFYIVGMKSYGRAPTFLMLTGYEQVRSVVAAITGDWDAARDVQLELPETGVCFTDLNAPGGGCCTVSSDVVELVGAEATTSCSTPAVVNSSDNTSPFKQYGGVALTVLSNEPAACCTSQTQGQADCCEPQESTGCCETTSGEACCSTHGHVDQRQS
jgi:thioredoxin reductase